MKQILLVGILLLFGAGCGQEPQLISPNIKQQNKKEENFKIDIKKDMDTFEKQLVEVAKTASVKYSEYLALLKTMKKERKIADNRIPRNMGKRYTFCFDGYALLLVKQIVTKSGYNFNLGQLNMQDSPIIHRCYKNTLAIDILKDLSTGYGYNLIINEKLMEVTVKYN